MGNNGYTLPLASGRCSLGKTFPVVLHIPREGGGGERYRDTEREVVRLGARVCLCQN